MFARLLRAGFVLAIALGLAAPVAAQSKEEQAKSFFKVARQLANAQRYAEAAQALEEAYGLVQRPSLLFWMAETWREKYFQDGEVVDLDNALARYDAYLKIAPEAEADKRRTATKQLAALRVLHDKLRPPAPPTETPPAETPPGGTAPEAPPPPEPTSSGPTIVVQTGIMASSPTPDAELELDGRLRSSSPLIADVTPGRHELVVRAPGHIEHRRTIDLRKGQVVPLDVALEPAPAVIAIRGPEGARVSVDGEERGTLPLTAPLRIDAGERFLAVTQNGREPYSQLLQLDRGQRDTLDVDLGATGQRYLAWSLLGTGAGGLVLGGIFTGIAVAADDEGSAFQASVAGGDVPASDVERYDDARTRRDRFRTGAIASFSIGALALGTGAVLFFIDEPTATPPLLRGRDGERPPQKDEELDLSLVPLASPWLGGAAVVGSF